ncbi:MAG: hypothetical protein ACLQQ4_18490 [Bacteroidia bacterium]
MTVSAKDLLQKTIELVSISPDGTKWSEENLKDPRQLYRYKQITVLLEAFGIQKDLGAFLLGDFTFKRSEADYKKLLREIEWVLSRFKKVNGKLEVSKRKLSLLFKLAFGYRLSIYNTMKYWDSYLLADPVLLFPQITTKWLNAELLKHGNILDGLLCSIIDPDNQEIPISILIEKYRYPDINIEQVDLDYI